MRIALVSEHAWPRADVGGIDGGGQKVYVARLAPWLLRQGHQLDVFTRRDAAAQGVVQLRPGLRVVHVLAGWLRHGLKEQRLSHLPEFARYMLRLCAGNGAAYDVVLAGLCMAGRVGPHKKGVFGWPLVMTRHALGLVRRRHQGADHGLPADRIAVGCWRGAPTYRWPNARRTRRS